MVRMASVVEAPLYIVIHVGYEAVITLRWSRKASWHFAAAFLRGGEARLEWQGTVLHY